jgi:CRISPR system Cascade subunit CasE
MIASMYKLNWLDCKNLRVVDAYSIHRIVYDLFPGNTRDFLFVDKGGDFKARKILIVSQRSPKIPQYGEIQSKLIPESFLQHENYGFETKLNPTTRDESGKKRIAIRKYEDLHQWFLKKSLLSGFETNPENLEIRSSDVEIFEHKNQIITYNSVKFVGKLRVIDKEKFHDSFCKGIGSGKAFGFGLLQIIPLNVS